MMKARITRFDYIYSSYLLLSADDETILHSLMMTMAEWSKDQGRKVKLKNLGLTEVKSSDKSEFCISPAWL